MLADAGSSPLQSSQSTKVARNEIESLRFGSLQPNLRHIRDRFFTSVSFKKVLAPTIFDKILKTLSFNGKRYRYILRDCKMKNFIALS